MLLIELKELLLLLLVWVRVACSSYVLLRSLIHLEMLGLLLGHFIHILLLGIFFKCHSVESWLLLLLLWHDNVLHWLLLFFFNLLLLLVLEMLLVITAIHILLHLWYMDLLHLMLLLSVWLLLRNFTCLDVRLDIVLLNWSVNVVRLRSHIFLSCCCRLVVDVLLVLLVLQLEVVLLMVLVILLLMWHLLIFLFKIWLLLLLLMLIQLLWSLHNLISLMLLCILINKLIVLLRHLVLLLWNISLLDLLLWCVNALCVHLLVLLELVWLLLLLEHHWVLILLFILLWRLLLNFIALDISIGLLGFRIVYRLVSIYLEKFLLDLLWLSCQINLVSSSICSSRNTSHQAWDSIFLFVVTLVIGFFTISLLLLLVLFQNGQTVWKIESWLLHFKVEDALVLPILVVVHWWLDCVDAADWILVSWVEILNFWVGDQSFFWLFAFFIKNSEVVPDFGFQSIQRSSFDYVFKWVAVISIFIVNDSQCCPISCFSWIFESGFLKEFKCFLQIVISHVASSLDIKGVSLSWLKLFNLSDVVKSLFCVSFLEWAPSKMLVDLEVAFISVYGCLVFSHCLVEISLLFIQ